MQLRVWRSACVDADARVAADKARHSPSKYVERAIGAISKQGDKSNESEANHASTPRRSQPLTKSGKETPIKTADHGEDLGVGVKIGMRCARTALGRFSKGAKRAFNGRRLVRTNPAASKLYATGVAPQQLYELPIANISTSAVNELRADVMRCLRRPGTQPCVTTTIRWKLRPKADSGRC